jgi:hypothetical protein
MMKRLIAVSVVFLLFVASIVAAAQNNNFGLALNLGVDVGYNSLAFDLASLGWSTPNGDPVLLFKAGIWRVGATLTSLAFEATSSWVLEIAGGRLFPSATLGLEFFQTGPVPVTLLVEGGVFWAKNRFFLRGGLSWPGEWFVGLGYVF